MSAPKSVDVVIRERIAADPDATSDAIARKLAKQLTIAQREELLVERIREIRRIGVRRREAVAFHQFFSVKSSEESGVRDIEPLRRIFGDAVPLGDGFRQLWGAATIAEHEQRIAMLRKIRGGIDETIRRHEEAIRLIQSAGVSCLDEIGEAA